MSSTALAAQYYNSPVAAAFYQDYWGGADIHIGLYATGRETVADASVAMSRHLMQRAGLQAGDEVLDIACGYGGTMRLLADLGCRVTGIDISEVCVERARQAIDAAGLNHAIDVFIGDFHALDFADDTFDAVVCQEALIHSPDRPKVFAEVARVLRPGGVFAFSDILTAPGADLELVQAAFDRLGARAGATAHDYAAMARAGGLIVETIEQRPRDITLHYERLGELLDATDKTRDRAMATVRDSIAKWQRALAGGHITWACFVARKPAIATP